MHGTTTPKGSASGFGPPASAATIADTGATEALAHLGAELLRRAEESQPAIAAAWDELMASWDVRGEPVGIARLREMMGHDRGETVIENDFSRELIALREERRP